jgi:hypothetical protein
MSGRIKSKVVNATLANRDILDMFQGVLGGPGGGAIAITHQKYLRIREHVERFLRLLAALRDSTLMMQHFPDIRAHLVAYTSALQAQFAKSFSAPDFSTCLPTLSGAAAAAGPTPADYARVPPALVEEFNKVFKEMKTCSLVNTTLVVCKNLIVHKKALSDQAALRDKFLRDAGTVFAPLPDLSQLNFKRIYNESSINVNDRKFIMVVLHKMLMISHDVYDALSAPDVDVDEFVEVIMGSIEEVKKHIPRCDQAFAKIVESVDLLRGNFSSYYKDYAASGNASIMMENFVLDVSKNTNASPQVTSQFRRIISHYRKLASQQSTNPKLQNIFAQVDANFKELEKATGGTATDAAAVQSTEDIAAEISAADAAEKAADAKAAAEPVVGKNAVRNRQRRTKAKAQKAASGQMSADSVANDAADEAADDTAVDEADDTAMGKAADTAIDAAVDEADDAVADEADDAAVGKADDAAVSTPEP